MAMFAPALLIGLAWPVGASASPAETLTHPGHMTQPGMALEGPSAHFAFGAALNQITSTPPQRPGWVCIAHNTGSASNPVVFIEIAPNAVPAHQQHGDTVVGPAPCPQ